MASTKTSEHDAPDYIGIQKELATRLTASLEDADIDTAFTAKALFDNAEAKEMEPPLREAALARERLYKALSAELIPVLNEVLKNPNRSNRRW